MVNNIELWNLWMVGKKRATISLSWTGLIESKFLNSSPMWFTLNGQNVAHDVRSCIILYRFVVYIIASYNILDELNYVNLHESAIIIGTLITVERWGVVSNFRHKTSSTSSPLSRHITATEVLSTRKSAALVSVMVCFSPKFDGYFLQILRGLKGAKIALFSPNCYTTIY